MGRMDQKFCSDQCRNTYNNKINKDETAYMQNVSRQLKRNRRILKLLNPNGKTKVKKHTLLAKGFNFIYFTNVFKNKEGKVYYFCFEYGYLPLDNDFLALVINRETWGFFALLSFDHVALYYNAINAQSRITNYTD